MKHAVDFITLKAAHSHLLQKGKGDGKGFVHFHEVKALLTANKPKATNQGWTFLGSKADWKRAVQPYYG